MLVQRPAHHSAIGMDLDRIFTADQIAVPPDLPQIIKDYTKAVIRACPEDLLTFSLAYFQKEVARTSERPGGLPTPRVGAQ